MESGHPEWRKSSFSGTETACIEIARGPETVKIRDSKNPTGGHLTIPASALHGITRTC